MFQKCRRKNSVSLRIPSCGEMGFVEFAKALYPGRLPSCYISTKQSIWRPCHMTEVVQASVRQVALGDNFVESSDEVIGRDHVSIRLGANIRWGKKPRLLHLLPYSKIILRSGANFTNRVVESVLILQKPFLSIDRRFCVKNLRKAAALFADFASNPPVSGEKLPHFSRFKTDPSHKGSERCLFLSEPVWKLSK